MEEYYKIKVDIECTFFILHNYKTKHIPNAYSQSQFLQNPQIHNVQLYKGPFLVVANSYKLRLDDTTMLELGRYL